MSENTHITDDPRRAYGPNEWADLYSQSNSYLQEVAVTLGPFAGLTRNGLAHLRSDWITWRDEFVQIHVPPTAQCNEWKLQGGGRKPQIVRREEPCWYCKNKGSTDQFENLWSGRGESGASSYKATLHRDLASPAVEILEKTLKTWGRPGIAATPGGLKIAVQRLLDEDSDTHGYEKLLRTGIILYCHYGLSQEDIADLTPFTKGMIEQIEVATPEVTRERNNSYAYLRTVKDNEPVETSVVADKLDTDRGAVYQALKRLEQENRVERNKSGNAHTWSTVGDWTAPFTCEVCGYNSPTLSGIRHHKVIHD